MEILLEEGFAMCALESAERHDPLTLMTAPMMSAKADGAKRYFSGCYSRVERSQVSIYLCYTIRTTRSRWL